MNDSVPYQPENFTAAERLESELLQLRMQALQSLKPEIADLLQANNHGDERLFEDMAVECMNDMVLAGLIAAREGLVARLDMEGYDKDSLRKDLITLEEKIEARKGYLNEQ